MSSPASPRHAHDAPPPLDAYVSEDATPNLPRPLGAFDRHGPWAFFVLLFAAVVGLTLCYELELPSQSYVSDPFTWHPEQRDAVLTTLLAIGTLAVTCAALFRFRPRFMHSRTSTAVLASLVFVAGLVYFYGAHGARPAYPHLHDSYHYFLGAKYYSELGYDGLYNCTAEALGPVAVPAPTRVRDLRNEAYSTAGALRREGLTKACAQAFSPERWQAFQHDLSVFYRVSARGLRGSLSDRGYNGSPFHSFVAAHIANAFPFSYTTLSLLTLLDVFAICMTLAAICRGFGTRLGLVTALMFFCQFVDRFQIIGGSFLRYQWFAALGFGLFFLKLGWFARGGAALAIAACLNVFPALFCVPIAALVLFSLLKRHLLDGPLRRIALGAGIATVVCTLLGAAHADGFGNYANFRDAMRVHNAAGRVPGLAVGLKVNFVSASHDGGFSANKREQQLSESAVLIAASAGLLLIASLVISTQIGLAEGAILFGFSGLFCIFGPTGYYFVFAPLLLLLWHRKTWDSGGLWMMASFFAISIPPYVWLLRGNHRFYVFNRIVSGTWTVYLVATLIVLGLSLYQARKRGAEQPSADAMG